MDYICWRRENVDTCKHIRSNFSAFLLFHVQSQTFYGGCKLAEHSFSYIRISIDEWRVWWLIVGAMLYFILYLIFKDICLLLYPWIFVLLCKIKTYEWKNISIFPSKGSWLLHGFQQRVISFIILQALVRWGFTGQIIFMEKSHLCSTRSNQSLDFLIIHSKYTDDAVLQHQVSVLEAWKCLYTNLLHYYQCYIHGYCTS